MTKVTIMARKWIAIKYIIFGVEMWAIEDSCGYIEKYCKTRQDAENYINERA